MADSPGPILVATDIASDADLIRKILGREFEEISVSTHADSAAQDFERVRPRVLLLAFNTLEKAERYYLGLYRFCPIVHSIPHRTLILCNKDDVRAVYELCRKEFFDDYILFWPLSHDGPRLLMSVHLAFRALNSQADAPSLASMAAQARQIASLEAMLSESLQDGHRRLEDAGNMVERAEATVCGAVDAFSRRMTSGQLADAVEVKDGAALESAFRSLVSEGVRPSLRAAVDAARPARQWAVELGTQVQPHLATVNRLSALAQTVRPTVLAVDDDAFQLTLLKTVLAEQPVDLITAQSGADALNRIRRRRPDLMFLDVALPDMTGIDLLRRLQGTSPSDSIPVVMVSGHSERQVVIDSVKLGARGFIVKPFDRNLILRKLGEILQIPIT